MWDMPVNTGRTITGNRPDIIVKDSVNSTCKLIDMTGSLQHRHIFYQRTKTQRNPKTIDQLSVYEHPTRCSHRF